MAKRFGRTLIPPQTADRFAYEAHIVGSSETDLAGRCQAPVFVGVCGHEDRVWLDVKPGLHNPNPRNVDLRVPCRRCDTCLRMRSAHWRHRAIAEIGAASRTWFGTLTLAPARQFQCMAQAEAAMVAQGLNLGLLTPREAFKERCKPLLRECQLWLKRCRKHAPGLRFCLVVERHKSGDPHVHLLVHERDTAIRHKVLTSAWTWGFSKFNLVAEGEKTKMAWYVAKYLSKESGAVIRASLRYGKIAASSISYEC